MPKKTSDALESLRALAKYKTHGGYAWAAVMDDGALMCTPCVCANYRQVFKATCDPRDRTGWRVEGLANSGESEDTEVCCNCGNVLWEREPAESDNTIELTAPSAWASYLINGDDSGIDGSDKVQADAWIASVGHGEPVSCESAGFTAYHDAREFCPLAADCETYVFYKKESQT